MENKNDEREERKNKSTTNKVKASTKKNTKTEDNKVKKEQKTIKKTETTIKKDEMKGKKVKSKTKSNTSNVKNITESNQSKEKNKIDNDDIEVETTTKPRKKTKAGITCIRVIWNIIVKILMIAIIFISIIIIVQKVTNNKESFLGFRIFRVQTGSMIPQYQVGDVILVKEADPNDIKIGDDVTYQGKTGAVKGILVTHRVIDIEEVDGKKVFHTQGIANNLEDPLVYGEQINGVVQTKMYVLSLICMLLNNKYIFYFCGILPLTIYVAFRIFRGKKVKHTEREN